MNRAPEPVPAGAGRPPAVRTEDLRRVYASGDTELEVLHGVSVEVAAGEAVAIVGASGAGKSTLLHLLGGLDRPSSGDVIVAGRRLSALSPRELAEFRNRGIGFVFQFHHLLREFTAVENVMMPLYIAGEDPGVAEERAMDLLSEVGLGARAQHRPGQLSGGEQQRVAVARALANRPAVVIADEPSGNLDSNTSEQLHDLFFRLRAEHGVALVLATHNRELADRTDRVLRLKDGTLQNLYPE
ncbi:MAG TPA: ABC transporter ATP-binding protein [Longimicrobiales bacterium]|nr:ABC transporter ATP-binding protein [Longimicrobiales bacterium]